MPPAVSVPRTLPPHHFPTSQFLGWMCIHFTLSKSQRNEIFNILVIQLNEWYVYTEQDNFEKRVGCHQRFSKAGLRRLRLQVNP